MPPSPPPAPSSELAVAAEEQKAVETRAAIEIDQAEPIDEDEQAEEEEEEEEEEPADATTAAADGDETTTTATPGLDFDLPRSILRRIVKARLNEVSAQELGEGKEFGVSKEALEALGEGAKVREKRERVSQSPLSRSKNAHFFFPLL